MELAGRRPEIAAAEFDFAPGLRLEERIDGAEGEGIEARWEFGRWMLGHVPEGGKKLPDGFLAGLAEATAKSRSELEHRRWFAAKVPTREALLTAVSNHRSWTEIRDKLLGSRNGMDLHYSSATDEWETPQDLFDELDAEFGFHRDVCATEANAKCAAFLSPEIDGLAQPWIGVCWMNPPYGDAIRYWVEKAWTEAERGATVVCLLPARVDTGWWWDYCRRGEIRFLRGRLKFGGGDMSAPFPSAVVVFRRDLEAKVVWWER